MFRKKTAEAVPTTINEKIMLLMLKWLFTLLAILWLYQALKPLLQVRKPPPPPPPGDNIVQKKRHDDEGEYIDYEEVK